MFIYPVDSADILDKLKHKITKRVEEPWEILLVDDGSSDDSLGIIQSLAEADSRVRFVSFARNCGQSAAFAAGFRF